VEEDKEDGRPEQSLYSYFQKLFGLGLVSPSFFPAYSQSATDTSLNAVRISDRADRAANGKLAPQITAAEHMRRAGILPDKSRVRAGA